MDVILPFLLCAVGGTALAAVELIRTFGRWIWRYWRAKSVLAIIALNVLSAAGVYAFLRYALQIENSIWLILITSVTFPTILRSRFIFYRPFGKAGDTLDTDSFSVTLDNWYRLLQDQCYDDVNRRIAAANSELQVRLKRCLTEKKMITLLEDNIAAMPMASKRAEAEQDLAAVRAIKEAEARERRLAVLMTDILTDEKVRRILRECGKP